MKRNKHQAPPTSLKSFPRQTKKGAINKRIIAEATIGNREYSLHATKGYRSRKV